MRAVLAAVVGVTFVSLSSVATADDRFTVSPEYPRRSWHPAGPDGRGGTPAPEPASRWGLQPAYGGAVPAAPCPAPCASPCETYDVCDPCARRTLEVGARARWWRAHASGDFVVTLGGEPGTGNHVELRDDLDLDTANAWLVGIDVRLGRHRARFAYEDLSFSGTSTLDRPRIFHGVTYPAGERVESDVSFRFFDAAYEYQVVGGDRSQVWAGVGGRLWTLDTHLKGTTSGLDEDRGFTHAMPFAGVAAHHRFGHFAITGSLRGGVLDDDRWMIDLEAALAWRPCDHVVLTLGWRRLEFAFQESTNTGDLIFSGPFLGLSASF